MGVGNIRIEEEAGKECSEGRKRAGACSQSRKLIASERQEPGCRQKGQVLQSLVCAASVSTGEEDSDDIYTVTLTVEEGQCLRQAPPRRQALCCVISSAHPFLEVGGRFCSCPSTEESEAQKSKTVAPTYRARARALFSPGHKPLVSLIYSASCLPAVHLMGECPACPVRTPCAPWKHHHPPAPGGLTS